MEDNLRIGICSSRLRSKKAYRGNKPHGLTRDCYVGSQMRESIFEDRFSGKMFNVSRTLSKSSTRKEAIDESSIVLFRPIIGN